MMWLWECSVSKKKILSTQIILWTFTIQFTLIFRHLNLKFFDWKKQNFWNFSSPASKKFFLANSNMPIHYQLNYIQNSENCGKISIFIEEIFEEIKVVRFIRRTVDHSRFLNHESWNRLPFWIETPVHSKSENIQKTYIRVVGRPLILLTHILSKKIHLVQKSWNS